MKPGTLNLKLFLSLFLCTQRLKLKENKKQVSELVHIRPDLHVCPTQTLGPKT